MRQFETGWTIFAATVILVASGTPAFAQEWTWPDHPENLQVLPENWTGQRLRPVMTGFTRALGVRCSHCHVGDDGQPLSTYDFASDDNPNKERARTMLKMLGDINQTLKTLEPSGPERVNMWCHTCHRGRPRPMTLGEELGEVYHARGLETALDHYEALRDRFYGRGAYDFGEDALNSLGYSLMAKDDFDGAVRVFLLNVEQSPESGNVYDSLAEAYMNRGDRQLAIEYYERSLELDPENDNAREQLKALAAGEH
ncbi:MAG: c-type cytochrome [marine benthic group bacterium]|nr:c-type cytochrome [Gemmatimonadota bacterium]